MRFFFASAALLALPAPGLAQEMHLVCGGGGVAVKPDMRDSSGTFEGSSLSSDGISSFSGTTSSTSYGTRDRGFVDQVDIEINGETARIRMPRTMLPVLRGGKNGWFKLKDLQITDRAITGSAAVNIINNPKVRIDRITGTISISGKAGDYSGRCEAIDPKQAKRKF